MYYQKFRDINKEFNKNEFETITFMVSIVFCYTLLLAFACFTIESNPPKWLSFPGIHLARTSCYLLFAWYAHFGCVHGLLSCFRIHGKQP